VELVEETITERHLVGIEICDNLSKINFGRVFSNFRRLFSKILINL